MTQAKFGAVGTRSFTVHGSSDIHISKTIVRTGTWEPMTTAIVSALLRPGDGFLDIGANIGWYSTLAAHLVGPNGRVIAIEPDPHNYELLVTNSKGLVPVSALNIALADRSGTMLLTRSPDNLGDHRLAAINQLADVDARSTIEVRVDTLDHLISEERLPLDRLRIAKLDTQGAETLIFRGARRLLADLPVSCALVVEFAPNLLRRHDETGADEHVSELLSVLQSMERPLYLVRKRTLKITTVKELSSIAEKCRHLGDELAVDVFVAPESPSDLAAVRKAVRRVMFSAR